MNTKVWYQSKTLWLNLIGAGLLIVGVLPTNQYTIGGLAILNMLNRLITTTALTLN